MSIYSSKKTTETIKKKEKNCKTAMCYGIGMKDEKEKLLDEI